MKTKRANRLFVCSAISRAIIAQELNSFFDKREFKKDDKRLTDSLCREYAHKLGMCYGETADEEENVAELMRGKFIRKHWPQLWDSIPKE
jgi:hypothetical protein